MAYKVFAEKDIRKSLITNKTTPAWKFVIFYDYDFVDELKNWCKENVGANNWNYYGEHKKIPFEFRFRRPEDALAFRMKFGIWN